MPTDIAKNSERVRTTFGSKRYVVCGALEFMRCSKKKYIADISYTDSRLEASYCSSRGPMSITNYESANTTPLINDMKSPMMNSQLVSETLEEFKHNP